MGTATLYKNGGAGENCIVRVQDGITPIRMHSNGKSFTIWETPCKKNGWKRDDNGNSYIENWTKEFPELESLGIYKLNVPVIKKLSPK